MTSLAQFKAKAIHAHFLPLPSLRSNVSMIILVGRCTGCCCCCPRLRIAARAGDEERSKPTSYICLAVMASVGHVQHQYRCVRCDVLLRGCMGQVCRIQVLVSLRRRRLRSTFNLLSSLLNHDRQTPSRKPYVGVEPGSYRQTKRD